MLDRIQRSEQKTSLFGVLIVIVVMSRLLSLNIDIPLPVYYGAIFATFLVGLSGTVRGFNPYMLIFVCFALISIWFNDIPSYFEPYSRLISFLIVTGLVSPLLYGNEFHELRERVFQYLNRSLLVIVVLSFLGYFTGIYSGQNFSGFCGITNHSITLGLVAAISMLLSVDQISSTDLSRKKKYLFVVIAVISFILMLLAASRGAILACMLGLVIYFFKKYFQRIGKFVQVLLFAIVLLVASYSFWSSFTDDIQRKFHGSDDVVEATSSRSDPWSDRISEFHESPLYGVGFSNMKYGLIDIYKGAVEPGSSWLAIFSMTGLLGGITFALLVLNLLLKLVLAKSEQKEVPVLLALFIFFIEHWFFEGYILASGTFEFLYSWLLLGVIDIYNKCGKIDVL